MTFDAFINRFFAVLMALRGMFLVYWGYVGYTIGIPPLLAFFCSMAGVFVCCIAVGVWRTT